MMASLVVVFAYILAARVPLKELEVRDEDAMSVATDKEAVCIWHVHYGPTFGAVVFISGVEPDIVFDVELPQSFVVLQRKAEDVTECESVLVVCVDVETVIDESCRCIL